MNAASNAAHTTTDFEDSPFAQLWLQPFTLCIQAFAQLQSESLRFGAERAAKDLRLPLQLARCANPVQALGLVASFAIESVRDHAAESQKLFSLAAGDFESATATVI